MTLQPFCTARGRTLEPPAERSDVLLTTVIKIDDGSIRAQPATLRRLAAAPEVEPDRVRHALSAVRRGQDLRPASGARWQ